MKTYLIDTFNRVSSTGRHLDFMSTIKSREWVVFNEDKSNVEKLVFFNDSKMLVSVNGKSSYAKWEYIKVNSALLIDDEQSKYLLKIVVCNSDIIVLNIDSTDSYSFLINTKSIALKDAKIEDIQWYLYDKCGIDVLTEKQREQVEEKKKRQAENWKKIQEETRINGNRRIKDIIWCGIGVVSVLILILILRECFDPQMKNHQSIDSIQQKEKVHVIKKGESLTTISVLFYNTTDSVESIKRINGLEDGDTIAIGTKLILP